MASLKVILIAGALVAGATNVAAAADLLPPPPPVPSAPPEVSGWYLRGDTGVAINTLSQQQSVFDVAPPFGFANNGSGVGVQAIVGAGVGYKFNNWFRFDVTGEYRMPTKYWGMESYNSTGFSSPNCPVICYDKYSGNISSAVVLANGYLDLGTWFGVTPYVGGGVGVAYNFFDNLTDTGIETGGYGQAPNHAFPTFAWAAMAGLSYWITPNIMVDFGYRFLDLGTFESNRIYCFGGCGASGAEHERFVLTSNEVRLGLRYVFAEVPPPAPPLVTKY